MKLSKEQISKVIQFGGFLGSIRSELGTLSKDIARKTNKKPFWFLCMKMFCPN